MAKSEEKTHMNPLVDQNYLTNNSKVISDDMIYYCFDVLHSKLHKSPLQNPGFPNHEFPLFVTWYTGHQLDLRGCIGCFSPLSLHDGLKEYALTSALRDTRFNPISKVIFRGVMTIKFSFFYWV